MLIDIKKKFVSLGSEWETYIQFLEIKNFIEASHCLRNIQMSIVSILTCIDQVCITENETLFSSVDIVPQIIDVIENDIRVLYLIQKVQDRDDMIDEMFPWDEMSDDAYPSEVVALLFDAIDIRKQIDVLGVTISTFLVFLDERATVQEKKFAKAMLKIYRQLLYFGKIEKIYFQIGSLKNEASERNSNDCTTRLQIIFSLHNQDKYILRVDMPHKGQDMIHINLNESIFDGIASRLVATAFPFPDDSIIIEQISFLGNDMLKLFYRQKHMFWFRVEFKKKVEEFIREKSKKDFLCKLYDDRCHYFELWEKDNLQEEIILSFLDKQCAILRDLNLNNFNELYFVKSDQRIVEALGKLRWIDNFVHVLVKKLCNEELKNINHMRIRAILWLIFDKTKEHDIMWQGRVLTKEIFIQEDLLKICNWIMEI